MRSSLDSFNTLFNLSLSFEICPPTLVQMKYKIKILRDGLILKSGPILTNYECTDLDLKPKMLKLLIFFKDQNLQYKKNNS